MTLSTQNKTDQIVQKIAEGYQPETIYLFGSQAWGNPGPDSDVDLFIVKRTTERRIDRARTVRKLIRGMGLPVDILVYTPEEVEHRLTLRDFFIEDIVNKGKVLYQVAD